MQHDAVFRLDHVQASTGTADRTLGLKYKVILGMVARLFTVLQVAIRHVFFPIFPVIPIF